MSAFKILCPHCQAPLRSGKSPRPGKHVDCPQCGLGFSVQQDMIRPATAGSLPGVPLDELLRGEGNSGLKNGTSLPPSGPPVMGILEPARKKAAPAALPVPPEPTEIPASVAAPASRGMGIWVSLAAGCVVLFGGAFALAYFGSGGSDPEDTKKSEEIPVARAKEKEIARVELPETAKEPTKRDLGKAEAPTVDLSKVEVGRVDVPKEETKPPLAEPVKAVAKEEAPEMFLGPATPGLPGMEPEKVNKAVLRGVGFLKSTQLASGSWSKGNHGVGFAAMGGLTLLECKFPAKDPSIQKAASFVRLNSLRLDQTYDLSLAILFLDRLGDSRDKPLIQGLALRLVAGQTDKGGWDYRCPLLTPQEMFQLITFLQKNQPKVALQLPRKDAPFQPPGDVTHFQPLDQGPSKTGKQPGDQPDPKGKDQGPKGPDQPGKGPDQPGKGPDQPGKAPDQPGKGPDQPAKGLGKDPDQDPAKVGPAVKKSGEGSKEKDGKEGKEVKKDDPVPAKTGDMKTEIAKKDLPMKEDPGMGIKPKILPKGAKGTTPPVGRPEFLPPSLRDIPAVAGKGKGKGAMRKGRDDNSNSQFAMLALWAARRHGVPTEPSLQLAGERYRMSQNKDDGWGYQIDRGSTPPMTGVGVLGLAMGIGTAPGFPKVKSGIPEPGKSTKPFLDDGQVDRGLLAFARGVGEPSLTGEAGKMQNLYFLWTVERVSMMYGLRTLGGKDWYGWGGQILLKHQNPDGSWSGGGYHGSNDTIDTCLALLFLKRSNLADDLTRNFQHFLVIRDPAGK